MNALLAHPPDSAALPGLPSDTAAPEAVDQDVAIMVDLLPEADDELSEAIEREIYLRAAELVERWELADPRDRWQHTGEAPPKISAEPQRRREPYRPAESTVQAFWYVATHEPDKLKAWLARHPDDAPALHRIWKAKRCS